jgi:hypothetical protein
MPFDYTMSEEDLLNFEFYEVSYADDSLVHLHRIYEKMLANQPCAIKPLNVGTYIFKAKNVELDKKINNRITYSIDSDSYIYNFYQTYNPTDRSEIDTTYDVYAMGGGGYNKITSGTVPSYRWYFIKVPKS